MGCLGGQKTDTINKYIGTPGAHEDYTGPLRCMTILYKAKDGIYALLNNHQKT